MNCSKIINLLKFILVYLLIHMGNVSEFSQGVVTIKVDNISVNQSDRQYPVDIIL